ncbi:hypothetical protein, partial [Amycolatopsis sp. NPDC059657]|uniref:hypothetical protein n=1 Tax=Amycolatopsis sp. NPDC059657 TaxID=3346899 RepID=UPI00366E8342
MRTTTGIKSTENPVHSPTRTMRRLIDDRIRQRRSRNLKRGVTQRPERPNAPRQPRPDIPPDLAQRTRQTLRHTTQRTTDRTTDGRTLQRLDIKPITMPLRDLHTLDRRIQTNHEPSTNHPTDKRLERQITSDIGQPDLHQPREQTPQQRADPQPRRRDHTRNSKTTKKSRNQISDRAGQN